MNEEAREKIQGIINDAHSFIVCLSESLKETELLLREAMRIVLKEKTVYFFPETPRVFKDKWSLILPDFQEPLLPRRISIHLPKENLKIREVGYEEDEEKLILNIDSEGRVVEKEDIIFENRPTIIDAAFCFCSPDPKKMVQEKIFISPEERMFFVNSEKRTLSEEVFDIIKIIDEKNSLLTIPIPTILLASLFLETNNLRTGLTPELLNFAGNLLEMGADKKAIEEVLRKDQSLGLAQIFGRALARTRINESLKSAWSFISFDDLKKTGNENANVPFFCQLISKVSEFLPAQFAQILLWEADEGIWALITMEDKRERLGILAKYLNSEIKDGFIVAGPYKNFSEAELKIQEALREII